MRLLASFEWGVIWDNRHALLEGLWRTIQVSVIGIVLATVIGLVLGAIRAYRIPVLSQLGGVYVEVIRNTPLLVQIIFLFFALPTIHAINVGVTTVHLGNALRFTMARFAGKNEDEQALIFGGVAGRLFGFDR